MLEILRVAIAARDMVFMVSDLRLSFGRRLASQRAGRFVHRDTSLEHHEESRVGALKLAHADKGARTRNQSAPPGRKEDEVVGGECVSRLLIPLSRPLGPAVMAPLVPGFPGSAGWHWHGHQPLTALLILRRDDVFMRSRYENSGSA